MHDPIPSFEFVNNLIESGVPREEIFLDLLANAARHFGELWESDEWDFSDVTIGLCRIHELLRKHSVLHNPESFWHGGEGQHRILLATACGDQHILGSDHGRRGLPLHRLAGPVRGWCRRGRNCRSAKKQKL